MPAEERGIALDIAKEIAPLALFEAAWPDYAVLDTKIATNWENLAPTYWLIDPEMREIIDPDSLTRRYVSLSFLIEAMRN